MKPSQRQAIQEVLEATRLHSESINELRTNQGVSRLRGYNLKDVQEGLDISATKLEVALAEDGDCDPKRNAKRNAKVVRLLKEKLAIAEREARQAKADVLKFASSPFCNLKWAYPEALVRASATHEYLLSAVCLVLRTIKDNGCPCAALREWVRSSLESIRVTRTSGRSLQQVFEEVEQDNGLKQAVQIVLEIIDFDVN